MGKLEIPERLKVEFATVEALWQTTAATSRVDALILSWVKYEKQLRKLFSFLVFQHPKITASKLDEVIAAFVANRNLNPETFISGIRHLGVTPLPKLLGDSYTRLWPEITRIRVYRNKIMHGQLTGQGISKQQLEKDVLLLIEWISSVADVAAAMYGYDGIKRKTYVAAKASAKVQIENYPFSTLAELRGWLATLKP